MEDRGDCQVWVFVNPCVDFTSQEIDQVSKFVQEGGSLWIMSNKGTLANLNEFLKTKNMQFQNDCVVGLASQANPYHHPKHVFISQGCVYPSLDQIPIVFPNGTIINVKRPSTTLYSSGPISHPFQRPIVGVWQEEQDDYNTEGGRIACVGSSDMFSDQWIEQQDNMGLCDIVLDFLLGARDFDPTECRTELLEPERKSVSDIGILADRLRGCLDGAEPLEDFQRLFTNQTHRDLFGLDNRLVSQVIGLYAKLHVPHEPLALIVPEFVTPLPKLTLAVHLPRFPELPVPSLELYDLRDEFLEPQVRLAHLTHKFALDKKVDLAHYLAEAGCILFGSNTPLDARQVLARVFEDLICYKNC